MKKQNRPIHFSLLLMGSSLLLLSVFLGLWLHQSYQQAYDDLQKEVDFTFGNSVQTVKNRLFAAAFPMSFQQRDSTGLVGSTH